MSTLQLAGVLVLLGSGTPVPPRRRPRHRVTSRRGSWLQPLTASMRARRRPGVGARWAARVRARTALPVVVVLLVLLVAAVVVAR